MREIGRRELLKAGAMAAVGLAAGAGAAKAAPSRGRGVHIEGVVTLIGSDLQVRINITVFGTSDDLSGSGWQIVTEDPDDVSGACYFTQYGSIHGNMVELVGRVLFANNPANVAAKVTTVANLATGEITWTLDQLPLSDPPDFVFQGTVTAVRV